MLILTTPENWVKDSKIDNTLTTMKERSEGAQATERSVASLA
jgi:hypothetical protein